MKVRELIAALDAVVKGEKLTDEGRMLLSRIAQVLERAKTWEFEFLFAALSKLKAAPLPPRGVHWYVRALRDAYNNDADFEQLIAELRTDRSVDRADVVELYHSLFESERAFAAKLTKPKLADEIRRERLARVRFR